MIGAFLISLDPRAQLHMARVPDHEIQRRSVVWSNEDEGCFTEAPPPCGNDGTGWSASDTNWYRLTDPLSRLASFADACERAEWILLKSQTRKRGGLRVCSWCGGFSENVCRIVGRIRFSHRNGFRFGICV